MKQELKKLMIFERNEKSDLLFAEEQKQELHQQTLPLAHNNQNMVQ